MVRSQLLGQAGGFFCRQSSHRPQVRELWEVGRDIIQRRHSVSPPGRNFLSVYHKKSRCNTRRIDSRNFIAQVAARDEYTQAMDNSEPEMVEARYSGHVECHPLVQLQKTLDRDAG